MDSPHRPKSLSTNLFYLFLLLSTNLLTLFLSSTFYSSSSCSLNPISTTTTFTKSSSRSTNGFDGTGNPDTPQATVDLPSEFLAFSSGQVLPLGFNANFGSDTFHPSVGQACTRFPDELSRFMSYKVNGSCPDDELFAQKLLLKGCEPCPHYHVRNGLNWRFRGNENVKVNDVGVQIFWDVHDWLFSGSSTSHGLFILKSAAQEGGDDKVGDGRHCRGNDGGMYDSPKERSSSTPEFFHVINAWKYE